MSASIHAQRLANLVEFIMQHPERSIISPSDVGKALKTSFSASKALIEDLGTVYPALQRLDSAGLRVETVPSWNSVPRVVVSLSKQQELKLDALAGALGMDAWGGREPPPATVPVAELRERLIERLASLERTQRETNRLRTELMAREAELAKRGSLSMRCDALAAKATSRTIVASTRKTHGV